ncbi:hypothetical protein PPL_10909 [Heterostelium album PN500]|uniref:Uncharacterized protein n=1 Tax=Heterostelium pallidum (strain ATCC 26659 / Pp 5 / PN500) TaxID=670386 RepID=D3BSE2_HETP5|nr:hypothetical protein PPL_10909 [Heterostelium album PN500]EFA75648.1 hypothetical protein PPL_10909 [Heterostelium album PN500]|eukprot:XP_020427782.1 hypothetical protein PPL_10909 [Heterostelium album PN500]
MYDTISKIYACLDGSYCTLESCSKMSGYKAEYFWRYNDKDKPISLPAITVCIVLKYIHNLFDWINDLAEDPDVFPPEYESYPKNFRPTVKKILSRLTRVYSHIYCYHYEELKSIGLSQHLNTAFKFLYYFILEFGLSNEAELALLQEVLDNLSLIGKCISN